MSAVEPSYERNKLERILSTTPRNIGRLLHYFPIDDEQAKDVDAWCGWHNDHGSLTGLCPAMYLDPQGK